MYSCYEPILNIWVAQSGGVTNFGFFWSQFSRFSYHCVRVCVWVYAFLTLVSSYITGCIYHKGTKKISIGVADDCLGLCNGMWCVYMLNLCKAN